MIRLRVQARRQAFARASSNDEDIWLCECCGETEQEGLVVYEVTRDTLRSGRLEGGVSLRVL